MTSLLNVRLLIIFVAIVVTSFASECYLKQDHYKCKLGTKTPYRLIANYDDTPPRYSGCTEEKIWLIFRHGTRYPGEKYVSRMIKVLPELQRIILENYKVNRTDLTEDNADRLREWKLSFTENDTMNLVTEGENEMIDLAERYQSRFPLLLPDVYDDKLYKFKYTASQRTEKSAKHFAIGLFGFQNSRTVSYPEAEYRDPVLRFYKRCTRWRMEIDKNPNTYAEKEKFIKSQTFTNVIENVSRRIGYRVNYETVRLMHMMCAFETAWNKDTESPWCIFFSLQDMKVLEFVEDIQYYWADGYGYKLTYEQACPALQNMFDFFMLEKNGTIATVYFTHSGTILKLLALLGMVKDTDHLTHDSFSLLGDERKWKISVIDAFASNIAFILYNCTSEGPSILLMHQERVVYLPGCPQNMPCPLSIMKEKYPDNNDECQFDAMCYVPENNTDL